MEYKKENLDKNNKNSNYLKKVRKNKSKKLSQLIDNSYEENSEKNFLFSVKKNKYRDNISKFKKLKIGIKDSLNKLSYKNFKKYKRINNDINKKSKGGNVSYLNIIILLYIIIYCIIFKYLKNKSKIDASIYENIYDENSYNRTLNNIKNMKKVVYTVNFGNYDELKNFNRQEGYDYFAFLDTDIDKYKYTNWTIVPISEEIKNMNVSDVKKTRFIKSHPHLFFKNYSLSIYIDASYPLIGDLNEFLLRILEPNYNIYCLEHYERDCIYKEIKEVVRVKREKKQIADIVEEKYKQENFPHDLGLIEGALIVRKHNSKECIYLMEQWWEQIKNYSHRDQLSFNYVLWKSGINNIFSIFKDI